MGLTLRKYLHKIKRRIDAGNTGLALTEVLLCMLALGDKLPADAYDSARVTKAFAGLRRYRFVRHVKEKRGDTYTLTSKGKERVREIVIDEVLIKSPKRWDGTWYLVMYDFPVRFKKVRDAFRWKLKDLGFYQFQKSAWIYPYPCEREVLLIADFYGVRRHIEILEVAHVLHEKKLKAHFGL